MRSYRTVLLSALSAAMLTAGCSQQPPAPDRQSQSPTPQGQSPAPAAEALDTSASIRELMDATVDPAADGIWESVMVVSDGKGTEKRQPRTPEEWQAVRRHVVTLIEAMNLVTMKGRRAAPPGTPRVPEELTPEQVDALLVSDRATFIAFAREMQKTTRAALDAVGKRDAEALLRAGSEIDRACESCHMTFWYPGLQDPRQQRRSN